MPQIELHCLNLNPKLELEFIGQSYIIRHKQKEISQHYLMEIVFMNLMLTMSSVVINLKLS